RRNDQNDLVRADAQHIDRLFRRGDFDDLQAGLFQQGSNQFTLLGIVIHDQGDWAKGLTHSLSSGCSSFTSSLNKCAHSEGRQIYAVGRLKIGLRTSALPPTIRGT